MCRLAPQSSSLLPSCSALQSSWSHQTCVCNHRRNNGQNSYFHHEQGIFTPFFFFFLSALYMANGLSSKAVVCEGWRHLFLQSLHRLFQKPAFLHYAVQIERKDSPITTWLQLLTSNPHLDEAFCEEKDKKVLLCKQPPDYYLSFSVLLISCSRTWKALQSAHRTRGLFFFGR